MSEYLTRKRLRTSGVTVIISLSLVLFMLGVFALILVNSTLLTRHFKENVGFQVFLKDTATVAQTDLLIQEMKSARYSKEVRLVTKEQAAVKLKQDLGEDFIALMGANPLLNCVEVKLNAEFADSDTLQQVEKALLQKHFVKEVVYQRDMIDKLNRNTRAATLFMLIFSGALLVVAVALIHNTIRLSIYSQRFLIRTMYLVGATRTFISRPFIFKGCRQGVIAGIIAAAMLTGFLYIIARYVPEIIRLQDENLLAAIFGGLVVTGVLISAVSAMFAVSRYLKLKTSDLYF